MRLHECKICWGDRFIDGTMNAWGYIKILTDQMTPTTTAHQGHAQEGAKVARATARLPSSTEVAPPKEL